MDLERIKQNFRIRSGRSQKKKKRPQSAELSEKNTSSKPVPTANGAVKSPIERQPEPQVYSPTTESHVPESEPTQNTEANGSSQLQKGEERTDASTEQVDATPSSSGGTAEERPALPRAATEMPAKKVTMDEEEISTEEEERPKPSRRETEPTYHTATASSDADDFDLQPPKPKAKPPSLETMAELLWSSGHLDALLHHPPQLARFSAFLQRYLPDNYPYLAQYLETQKAIKAVEYANAIAEGLAPKDTNEDDLSLSKQRAAELDAEFEKISNASFKALVHHALPTFINYLLVKVVSECLTNEITGRSTPVMRDLVGGLSEVFCLTDPKREDNPIIYASEEFYRLTRYGPEDVINNNCRFLQGKKTNPESPKRLKAAVQAGEEITETLLNYRRDGRPFINMLMIAPLHDKHGKLKYHIGAQIDVSGLVEGGRALQGFQRYLNKRSEDARRSEVEQRRSPLNDDQLRKKKVLAKLRDLSESFDLEESAIVQAHSRSNSLERDDDDIRSIESVDRAPRRYYADSEESDLDDEEHASNGDQASRWKLGDSGDGRLSGKLPGVYDSFMLLKPAPSLRIVFVSPKLRQFREVLQTPFMSHISAPAATITGLNESLKEGIPVSAKIHFSTERGVNRDGNVLRSGHKHEDGKNGFAIWVSCTPMLDADDRIGVWMCVIVEKSKVGAVRRRQATGMQEGQSRGRTSSTERPNIREQNEKLMSSSKAEEKDKPIKPVRIGSKPKTDTTKKQVLEEAAKSSHGQKLKEKESVYFDTEQTRGFDADESSSPADPYRLNGLPEESVIPDENLKQVEVHSLTHGPQTINPERPYEQLTKTAKPFSARIPGLNQVPSYDLSDDEVITVQSPSIQQTSPRQNERVLIEEDSDFVSADESSPFPEEDLHHHRENLDVGSPDAVKYASAHPEPEENQHWMDHEIPPSVPASVYLPDDDEEEYALDRNENSDQGQPEEKAEEDVKYENEKIKQENIDSKGELAIPQQNDEFSKSGETLRPTPGVLASPEPENVPARSTTESRDVSYSPPYNRAQSKADAIESEMSVDDKGQNTRPEEQNSEQVKIAGSSGLNAAEPVKHNSETRTKDDADKEQPLSQDGVEKSEELEVPVGSTKYDEAENSEDLCKGTTVPGQNEVEESETSTEKTAPGKIGLGEARLETATTPEAEVDLSTQQEGHISEKDQDQDQATSSTVKSDKQQTPEPAIEQNAAVEPSHIEEEQQPSTPKQTTHFPTNAPKESKPNTDIAKLEEKFQSLGTDLQELTSPPASTVKYRGHAHTDSDQEYGREEDFGLKTPTSYQSDLEESAELPVTGGSSEGDSETRKSDQDKDSAISMQSPAQFRRTPVSESPEPPQSPPLSPARQTAEVEPDLQHDRPVPRHVDVENWVQDNRPASSHDTNKPRVPMDYLRAGSARWSNARRPQLSLEMLEQVNKGAHFGHGDDDDDEDTNDPCIRSPYSVD